MSKNNYSGGGLKDSNEHEESDFTPEPSKWLKARALISAMLINILIGSYYVYGNINEYCANFMHADKNTTLFIQPLWQFIQGGGVVFSIRLCERFGYRVINFWSFLVYIITNLTNMWITNYWVFFLTFGVINGVAVGFGYLPSLYIAWTYFPDSKSVITGCILFFAGLSTLILAPLTTAIVNPNDLPVSDPGVTERVPQMWGYISALYTVIWAVSVALQPAIWDPEAEKEKKIKIKKTIETENLSLSKKDENQVNQLDKDDAIPNFSDTRFEKSEDKKMSLKDTRRKIKNVVPTMDSKNPSENEVVSPTKRISRQLSLSQVYGDQAGFKFDENDNENLDELDMQILEAMDRKILEADVNGVVVEGATYIIADIPQKNMKTVKSRHTVGQLKDLSHRVSQEHTDNTASKRIMSALVSLDMYKLSKQIIESECPSIFYGMTSWHYICLITIVTTSMAYDYFLNAQWKDYGKQVIKDDDGQPISDKTITIVMIVASLCNAFVRVFVGKLLQTVSYKKFYLVLVGQKIVSAFCLQLATANLYTYTVCVSYAYMCIGSQSTLFPTFAIKVFGSKVGAKMFPQIYFFFAIANVLQWAQGRFLFNSFEKKGTQIYILGGMSIVAFILTFFIEEKPNWYAKVQKYNEEQRKKQKQNS